MVTLNLERGEPCPIFQNLIPDLLQKVVPRLLKLLKTGANIVTTALVYGDFCCRNAAITKHFAPIIFDLSSFYAHNECKI